MVPYENDDDRDLNPARSSRPRRRGGRRRSGNAVSDDPPVMPQRMEADAPPTGPGAFPLGRWLVIALVLVVAYKARSVLVVLIIALLFAHVLAPVVTALVSIRIGGRALSRSVAAALVMLVSLAAFGLFVSTLVPLLVTDFVQLLSRAPAYLHTTQAFVTRLRFSPQGLSVPDSWWKSLDASISAQMGNLAGVFGRGAVSVLSHVAQLLGLVVIPILTFHLLRDGLHFTTGILSMVPSRQRLNARGLVHDIDHALAAYVRGQTLVCLVMGVSVGVGLTVIGFPYAPLLGTFAGLAEAVPYVGALAMEVLLAVIGLSVSPSFALLGPAVYFGLNQVLGLLVTPHLMGRRLDMHPMTVILAVFVGGSVAGFAGVLLALPGAAIVNVLLDRWRTTADAHR